MQNWQRKVPKTLSVRTLQTDTTANKKKYFSRTVIWIHLLLEENGCIAVIVGTYKKIRIIHRHGMSSEPVYGAKDFVVVIYESHLG